MGLCSFHRVQILGNKLYALVEQLEHDHAGKVTGMLLEMDKVEILQLLHLRRFSGPKSVKPWLFYSEPKTEAPPILLLQPPKRKAQPILLLPPPHQP